MKATLTYDLNDKAEAAKHQAALNVEQLGGVISGMLFYLSSKIEQSKSPELENAEKFLIELVSDMDFTDIVNRTWERE